MPYWEETRILIDRSFGLDLDATEEFERKIVEAEYKAPGSLLAIALNPEEKADVRGVAARIIVELLGTSVCKTVRIGANTGIDEWDPDESNYVRKDPDMGVGFSATGEMDSGELPLELNVEGVKGTVYLSQEMWQVLGEKAGWLGENLLGYAGVIEGMRMAGLLKRDTEPSEVVAHLRHVADRWGKLERELRLSPQATERLREICLGSQWCLHCQEEVECGPISGLCPECEEETVPPIGRTFLLNILERFEKVNKL